MRVLETACGPGMVTRRLAERLRGAGSLMATDLNEAMITYGRTQVTAPPVEWQPADATRLPFSDRSFDAVICPFGLMFFPADPPMFYSVPFSLHDPEPVRNWLGEAGFTRIEVSHLAGQGSSPSAAEAAIGLIEGNPIGAAVVARGADALEEVKRATATAVAAELGDRPVRIPLHAVVFSASRPETTGGWA
jgi:SAM-dependent methyltransferase